jgi:hypothetical protein
VSEKTLLLVPAEDDDAIPAAVTKTGVNDGVDGVKANELPLP